MSTRAPQAAAPITEDDAFIAAALESASIPTLMMSMVHITGDPSVLRGPIKPGTAIMSEVQGFMSEEDKTGIRAQALEVLKAFRDRGCTLPPPPDPRLVHEMMRTIVGEDVPDEYVPMMLEEMALDGEDTRDVGWAAEISADRRAQFHVVVIGAGMSGLLAAIRLQEAGLGYTIVEKNDAVGGTWLENTYPGCRVDIANHFYCYSFEPNHDWSHFFAEQPELRDYLDRCASKYGVRDRIRFGTEVVSARFDEATFRWQIDVRTKDGAEETLEANAVISAVGQLNRPKIPDLPGLATFRGPAFHSADWQHQHSLAGKRVAVIGTGASGLQLVPEIAKDAGELFVFQRSPAWMFPNPKYHDAVSDGMKWLLGHVPYYARWYRFLLFWPGSDGLLPFLKIDPTWPHPERSVSELNETLRVVFTDAMAAQVKDDPPLLAKVIPTYPPFGKRMLQDNGAWLHALQRDNVELVTDGIGEITADAIVSRDGRSRAVDVIVFATGFHANKFLWPMEIVGRGGVTLGERWGDDPKAYLGITVPRFPNLFCLYGPGTNLAHAGSIIFHSECQVRYTMACLRVLLETDTAALDCKEAVCDAFNAKLDATLAKMVWSHPGMTSWYKNGNGRVTATSPWRLLDYWSWTHEPDLADYELLR